MAKILNEHVDILEKHARNQLSAQDIVDYISRLKFGSVNLTVNERSRARGIVRYWVHVLREEYGEPISIDVVLPPTKFKRKSVLGKILDAIRSSHDG